MVQLNVLVLYARLRVNMYISAWITISGEFNSFVMLLYHAYVDSYSNF